MGSSKEKKDVDPIGAELIIAILATAINLVGTLHQFGLFSKKRKKILLEFENLYREVFRLQNSLDDLILTLERYSHQSGLPDLGEKPLTIRGTLFYLEKRDYVRWIDVQDTIKRIDRDIYHIVSKIRSLSFKYEGKFSIEPSTQELTESFDELLLNMGKMTFGAFIMAMRSRLSLVEKAIHRLISHKGD
jgi:hypothetical protein